MSRGCSDPRLLREVGDLTPATCHKFWELRSLKLIVTRKLAASKLPNPLDC
ncbi:hypothetical protein [Calothrix sp. NIES-2100]|uniref:hypothetical protein n=1 Tax=Calothrix sp. NIES-2100 TaxID=1954172 RepID=UPI0030DBDC27